MFYRLSPHSRALLQALFVTFLWATSWVLIKVGLADLPALTFAGLRYTLAFLFLLPFALSPVRRGDLAGLTRGDWLRLALLGLVYYTLAQGAQFVSLSLLPAITVNLLLSFTSLVVALLGTVLLAERPSGWQWAGVLLSLGGALLFFYPVALSANQWLGIVVTALCVLANAGAALLGRYVNRGGTLAPLTVTGVSMGIGSLALLTVGVAVEGLPPLTLTHGLIIGWLAVVNTAFAFTLWNRTLRTLSAMESSVINSTMLIHIPLLAVLFLGEQISWKGGAGLLLAGVGALVVQVGRARR